MRLGPQGLHDSDLFLRAPARLWKFSLSPTNSTSFQPTPIPSRNRPPHSTSSEAACLATSTAWRWARISTPAANPICRCSRRGNRTARTVVIGIGGGADTSSCMIGGRIDPQARDRAPPDGVAKPFRGLGVVAQYRRTRADVGHRYRCAELHLPILSIATRADETSASGAAVYQKAARDKPDAQGEFAGGDISKVAPQVQDAVDFLLLQRKAGLAEQSHKTRRY